LKNFFIDFTKEKTLPQEIFNIETGDKWFNQEIQTYTDSNETIYLDEEGLHLKAFKKNNRFVSARITTEHKQTFLYGTLSIKAKLPKARGSWPAIWMLSDSMPFGRWPNSGEIDIVEYLGNHPGEILFSLHTETYNHKKDGHYHFNHKMTPEGFHTYTLDWTKESLSLKIDGSLIHTFYKGDKRDTTSKGWPFDHPFHLLFNVAVGGMLGGEVVESDFPDEMVIASIHYQTLEDL